MSDLWYEQLGLSLEDVRDLRKFQVVVQPRDIKILFRDELNAWDLMLFIVDRFRRSGEIGFQEILHWVNEDATEIPTTHLYWDLFRDIEVKPHDTGYCVSMPSPLVVAE